MRTLVCVLSILALAGIALSAPNDTKPAQATAEAFIKTIVDKDFEAFKALCASKLQKEHAKNPKNCMITRWWDAAQEGQTRHGAKWMFKDVKSNLPKNVTLRYIRTNDSGESEVPIGVILEGDKWLVDSAGAL